LGTDLQRPQALGSNGGGVGGKDETHSAKRPVDAS